jgi:hypothetical protein
LCRGNFILQRIKKFGPSLNFKATQGPLFTVKGKKKKKKTPNGCIQEKINARKTLPHSPKETQKVGQLQNLQAMTMA